MKSLLFVAAVSLISHSALSTSIQPTPLLPAPGSLITNFIINKDDAKFSKGHVERFVGGHVSIDYANNEVTVNLEDGSVCDNQMCLAFSETLVYSAKITSIEDQGCGINLVTAVTDMRPVDGQLTKISITDYSQMTCRMFIGHSAKGVLKTSFYNRFLKKTVTEKSEFTANVEFLEPVLPEYSTYVLAKGEYSKGLTKITPIDGKLLIGSKTLSLSIQNIMVCGIAEFCQITPDLEYLSAELEIVERTESGCGDRIVAQTPMWAGAINFQKVTITDYSRAVCDIYLEHMIHVEYSEFRPTHELEVSNSEIKGRFYFNPAQQKY